MARLRTLVDRGDGYVVLDGGVGTLLELFLVWNLLAIGASARPCILVGAHWRRALAGLARETQLGPQHVGLIRMVDTVDEAVDALQGLLS
jgi:predicted Rossmann-fold nucleotide-binding protein